MPKSSFVYEEGEAIDIGRHGQHDFLFQEGTEIVDRGKSSLVFEEGTGLGEDLPPPLHRWKLDETSGTTAVDDAGSYDGTYQNSPTLGVSGKDGTAVEFDESQGQFVEFGTPSHTFTEFTFTAWIYVTEPASGTRQIMEYASNQDSGELHFEWKNNNTVEISVPNATVAGEGPDQDTWEWYAASAKSGGRMRIYKNGNNQIASTGIGSFNYTPTEFAIGKDPESSQYWDGRLDDIRVYDERLTDQQIDLLYNSY